MTASEPVAEGGSGDHPVFAKCARRLIPFMVILFTVNYIDRVNVGFAALTMNKDLGFSPSTYGFGAGVFFIGYFACQVPSNIMLARIGARRWIFAMVILWGVISTACAFIQDARSFYALRFLLGAAEAGFFPGMVYYFTLWFPHSYRARLAGTLLAANPLANVIGGPLSSFLLGMDGTLGFHGWQWLFLLEGLPASLLAIAVFELMPDGPERASWLDVGEKAAIAKRLAKDDIAEKRDLWPALIDPRVLALSLVAFGIQSSLFALGLWLPQMVQAMGFSPQATGFVIVPPYALSAVAMIVWGRLSDRRGERVWHVALPALMGAAALMAASVLQSIPLMLIVLSIAVVGILSTLGPFWGMPSTFLGSMASAGGIALINAIGSLGGFLAPSVVGILKEQTGGYSSAMAVLAAGLLASAAIVLVLGRSMRLRRVQFS